MPADECQRTSQQFLWNLYDMTGGQAGQGIDPHAIATELGLDEETLAAVLAYLRERGLITAGDGAPLALTPAGQRWVDGS